MFGRQPDDRGIPGHMEGPVESIVVSLNYLKVVGCERSRPVLTKGSVSCSFMGKIVQKVATD